MDGWQELNLVLNLLALVGLFGLAAWQRLSARGTRKAMDELRSKAASDGAATNGRLEAIEAQTGRLASNLASLTTQISQRADVTDRRLDAIASRDQTESIVQREIQNLALLLMRNGVTTNVQTGGSTYRDGTQVAGAAIGGGVGKLEEK